MRFLLSGTITFPIAVLLLPLYATATTVEVEVKNLSSTPISRTSGDSSLPAQLAPHGTASINQSFTNTSSNVLVRYRAASGKTCTFTGSHHLRSTGNRLQGVWNKAAVASGNAIASSCLAIQTVRRYSAPWDYKLTFLMTD